MSKLAVIGGTGLSGLGDQDRNNRQVIETPFGLPSGALVETIINGKNIVFLPRHGEKHTIAPHRINYRANIWALQALGVTHIISVAAVGGITPDTIPGYLVCPDQIIDYTYGREQSFFSDDFSAAKHIDFTYPYNQELREKIMTASKKRGLDLIDRGVYGTTQGPRLESGAEIIKMAKDGCTIVGMTGMPEATLARELNIHYACCALVVNRAAGLSDSLISMSEVEKIVKVGMSDVKLILRDIIEEY